jgi:hypothetical protein
MTKMTFKLAIYLIITIQNVFLGTDEESVKNHKRKVKFFNFD